MSRAALYILKKDGQGGEFARCAEDHFARTGGSPQGLSLCRAPEGKPFFSPGGPRFSVSHSAGIWAAAFSEAEIGLDVQKKRPAEWQSVAKRFFHPEEREFVLALGEEAFFSVWAAKEAYVKFTGEGIGAGFSAFSSVQGGALAGEILGAPLIFPPAPEGYAMALCGADEVEVITDL